MTIDINNTRTLLEVVQRSHKPTTTLVDTFFPHIRTFVSEYVEVEYKSGGRAMAPFVVPGGKGAIMGREGSNIRTYKAPLMKPRRLIEASDVERRGFGETVYSTKSPEARAQELRAQDLADLIDMCARRQEWMAAQLLINGGYDIEGYADDGKTIKKDTIAFQGFAGKTTLSGSDAWDNAAAKIYDHIEAASQTIRRNAGMIPGVAICSSNVVKYLLNNKQLLDILMVPNRDNMALMSLQPKLVRPEVLRVGYIQSLNLEIYSYDGGYLDDQGNFKTYVPDDHFIMGIAGRGKRLFGAVTQVENDGTWKTYEGEYIPKSTVNVENDVTTLAVSSRCVLAPEFLDDWMVYKVK